MTDRYLLCSSYDGMICLWSNHHPDIIGPLRADQKKLTSAHFHEHEDRPRDERCEICVEDGPESEHGWGGERLAKTLLC